MVLNKYKDIGEQLKQYFQSKGIKQEEIADRLEITQSAVSAYFCGKSFGKKSAVKWGEAFNLNPVYLLTGEGEMLKGANAANAICDSAQNYRVIPIYNLDVAGGRVNGEVDIAEYKIGEMPFVDAKEGDICVPVSGKSMLPTYPAGTFVQLREVERWREYTELGQTYVLVLKDGRRLIKEIRCSNEDKKENFVLFSHNPNFAPQEIPKELILRIYLVIASYVKEVM